MKNFLIKLGNVNRRMIFLLIGLSILIPLLKPNWVSLPIKIDNNTKIVFDSIADLKSGDKILLSFEYGASTKPEIHPMAVALLKQLFAKNITVYIISLWPEGPIMSQQAIEEVKASNLFDIKEGYDYIIFDYKAGGEVVIKNVADDFRSVYKQDVNRTPIENIAIMNDIVNVNSFDFVFDFSAGVPGNAEWVQYACDPKNVPLSSGCTSIMVTDAIPYVESGQLRGIIAGMPGAAEYEKMVHEFLLNEVENGNSIIINDIGENQGKAFARMSSQSVAHLLMVIFILFGNISFYYSKRKNS